MKVQACQVVEIFGSCNLTSLVNITSQTRQFFRQTVPIICKGTYFRTMQVLHRYLVPWTANDSFLILITYLIKLFISKEGKIHSGNQASIQRDQKTIIIMSASNQNILDSSVSLQSSDCVVFIARCFFNTIQWKELYFYLHFNLIIDLGKQFNYSSFVD